MPSIKNKKCKCGKLIYQKSIMCRSCRLKIRKSGEIVKFIGSVKIENIRGKIVQTIGFWNKKELKDIIYGDRIIGCNSFIINFKD